MILNATGRFLVQCGGGVLNYAGNMDSCTDFMWTLPWGKSEGETCVCQTWGGRDTAKNLPSYQLRIF